MGDALRIESLEGAAIILTLVEDRAPTQTCLCAFQNQELEERAVIVHRHGPFFIVITNVLVASGPAATDGLASSSLCSYHPLTSAQAMSTDAIGDAQMLCRTIDRRVWPSANC